MKRLKQLVLPILSVLTLAAATVGIASAASKNVDIAGITNKTIYKTGQTVRITGTVNGDIICGGQTVTIDAQVNGDVICAGQTVTVNGNVQGSVRLAGQTVNLNGKVANSASFAAQDFTLGKGASISGDVGIVAQTALFDGVVGRDINGSVKDLTTASTIGRNVDVNVDKLTLASGTDIRGNVVYTARQAANKVPAAQVAGTLTQHQPKEHADNGRSFGAWLATSLFWLGFIVLFSMALVLLFPQVFRRWNMMAGAQPWKALLIGFLATIFGPVLFLTLLLTVIGIPLALFYLLVSIVLACLSLPFAAYYVGDQVFRHRGHVLLTMLVGIALLWLVSLVPVLGAIIILFAFWFGLGILFLNIWRLYPRPRYATSVKRVEK